MSEKFKELKGIDEVFAAGVKPLILDGTDAEKFVEATIRQSAEAEGLASQTVSSTQIGDEITAAIAFANELPTKVVADAGAPFTPDALRALALLNAQRPDEYHRARDRLKKVGVGLRDLESRVRQYEKQMSNDDGLSGPDGHLVRDEADKLDLPLGVTCPPGYLISKTGVQKSRETDTGTEWEVISHEPVLISGRTENLDDGTKGVELSFGVDGRGLQTRVVGQRMIADVNQLLELSNFGLSVTSLNKSALVGYLADQLDASKLTLPAKLTTGRSGWIEVDGKLAFILGTQVYSLAGGTGPTLEFVPINAHGQSVLRSTLPKGDLATWTAAVQPLTRFRHFVLVLGAAFGGPLLQPMRTMNNPIIHFQGESSRGKTTLMMVAASVFAFPGDSSSANAFIKQWRGTDNAIESLAFTHNGLILILDEVGQADPNTPKKVIYLVGNGQVKSRADSTGQVKPPKNFNLIFLSTGELSLAGNQTTTGQEVRMVEINKSPFDEDQSDLRDFVDHLRATIHDNYGKAGEVYLRELVEIINDPVRKQSLVDAFNHKHRHLLRWQNSPFHGRNARAFATMWLGFEEANRLFGFISDTTEIERIFVQLYQEAGEKWATDATTVDKAIKYVWDKIEANLERFSIVGGINMLGTIVSSGGLEGCYAFFEPELNKVLVEGGFDPKSAKHAFREKGYILLAKDGGLPQVRVPDGKHRPRSYVFHRAKVPHIYKDQTEGRFEE